MQDETQHVVQLSETPASASELSQVLVDTVDWPPPVAGRRGPDHGVTEGDERRASTELVANCAAAGGSPRRCSPSRVDGAPSSAGDVAVGSSGGSRVVLVNGHAVDIVSVVR